MAINSVRVSICKRQQGAARRGQCRFGFITTHTYILSWISALFEAQKASTVYAKILDFILEPFFDFCFGSNIALLKVVF